MSGRNIVNHKEEWEQEQAAESDEEEPTVGMELGEGLDKYVYSGEKESGSENISIVFVQKKKPKKRKNNKKKKQKKHKKGNPDGFRIQKSKNQKKVGKEVHDLSLIDEIEALALPELQKQDSYSLEHYIEGEEISIQDFKKKQEKKDVQISREAFNKVVRTEALHQILLFLTPQEICYFAEADSELHSAINQSSRFWQIKYSQDFTKHDESFPVSVKLYLKRHKMFKRAYIYGRWWRSGLIYDAPRSFTFTCMHCARLNVAQFSTKHHMYCDGCLRHKKTTVTYPVTESSTFSKERFIKDTNGIEMIFQSPTSTYAIIKMYLVPTSLFL